MIRALRFSCLLLLVIFVGSGVLSAQGAGSVSLQVTPAVSIPVGHSADLFAIGGGASLGARYVLPRFPLLFLQGFIDYRLMPTLALQNLSLLSAGAEAGVSISPIPWLNLEASLRGGGYVGLFGGESPATNPLVGGTASARFRLSPGFSLGTDLSYSWYMTRETSGLQALWNGISFAVTGGVRLARGNPRPQLQIAPVDLQPVFPVFYKYYDRNPFGRAVIQNRENGSIENVHVSFFVGEFMESPKECMVIPQLKKDATAEVPVYALFRDEILRITESTSVTSEMVVEYVFAGELRRSVQTQTLRIHDRNALTWDDDRKAASFVSLKDQTVLRFSKGIVGDLRERGAAIIDANLRNAIALFAGMGVYGLNYVIDPQTPYAQLSEDSSALDYLQFPRQTLEFKAGDCDDLSILYAALLESVGIATAFITTPGHIYLAFALSMTPTDAQKTLYRNGDIIVKDEMAWVPVEVTLVQAGFLKAWEAGARLWRENQPNAAGFYPLAEAWKTYEPVGLTGEERQLGLPDLKKLSTAFDGQLKAFIDREVGPQEAELKRRIAATKQSTALVNRLGLLYARYGKYDQAIAELEKITGRNPFVPALVNLGNIYFLRSDYNRALNYYSLAARQKPADAAIQISLARVQFELERYDDARAAYRRAESEDPRLAARFSYIVSDTTGVARASAQDSKGAMIWNDTE
jgi:tetratricopeptide (TPR) repeat protein